MARNNPVLLTGPTRGLDGRTTVGKPRAPTITDGRIGDFWIDTVSKKLYGPKNAAEWPDNGLIKGDKGWTPAFATVTDGTRRVQQIVDWTGGEGAKPAVGQYVGADGLVDDIEDAVDFRGPSGPQALINALDPKADAVTYDTLTALSESDTDNEKGELKRLFEPGGSLPLPTLAAAQAEVIPVAIKSVEIHSPRRTYKRVASEPVDRKFRSADRWTPDGNHDSANGGWWSEDTSLFATQVDMSGGVTGAPSLSLPELARRRYVDVGAYAPLNDTVDAHAAMQAAFNDGAGREVVFTQPIGGLRYYRSLLRGSGRLFMPRVGRVIFEPGAVLDFSDWTRSGTSTPYLYSAGTYESAAAISADRLRGSSTLPLMEGQGDAWRRGDHGYLVSDAMFTVDDGVMGTRGEWVSIVGVSGDTLQLSGLLRDNYLVSDNARLHRISNPAQTVVENPQIIGAGRFASGLGDRGIQILNGVGCSITGGFVKYADFMGVVLQTVLNGKCDNVLVEFEEKGASEENQYGVAIVNGCEATEVTGCDVLGGKEAYALSISGPIQGVTRDIVFANNRGRWAWRSAYCTHSNHIGLLYEGNTAEDCEQGFDIRITDARLTGNIIRRMGRFSGNLSCGVQLASGAGKVNLQGNYYEDMLRGVWMPSSMVHEFVPGDITAKGEVMRGIKARGVLLDYRLSPGGGTNSSDPLGTVSVTDCDIDCVTSGSAPAGVELHGRWTKPVVARNTFRGGAGAGTRCITIHATSNGGGTAGAISPSVIDNEFDEGYLEPGVSHATGIVKIKGNRGIGHWASGETIRGSKTYDFGSIAGGAWESTTVTVVGARAADRAVAWLTTVPSALWLKAYVSADDTVTVHAINFTGGPVDPANGTLFVEVVKA